ncbi:MAG: hypothetical protein M3O70_02230 [Actinomycetota bacterium]|nr:hypothetical protein [Actinomycetota bacterium]
MSNQGGRVYNLRGVYHLLARVAPFWIGFVLLSGVAISIIFVLLATRGGDGSLLATLAFLVVFWTVGVLFWWPSLGYVKEVRMRPDGALVMTTIYGRTAIVDAGEVEDVREQVFIPQPGSTRVRTTGGRTLYLGPFKDKYELVDAVRRLQRDGRSR